MSAANDIVKPRRSWLRRNSESPSGLKVVGDVPPDLANNIDEDGSLVTVDPADWIVCFVPGLRRSGGIGSFITGISTSLPCDLQARAVGYSWSRGGRA